MLSHQVCYVAAAGAEHGYRYYQVMINPDGATLVWVPASDGEVPNGALQGGMESNGCKLFIGRAQYKGSLVVGKVHPTHRVLYAPFDGKEIAIKSYEVLVCQTIGY